MNTTLTNVTFNNLSLDKLISLSTNYFTKANLLASKGINFMAIANTNKISYLEENITDDEQFYNIINIVKTIKKYHSDNENNSLELSFEYSCGGTKSQDCLTFEKSQELFINLIKEIL